METKQPPTITPGESFASTLKRAREIAGLSQTELATRLGVNREVIWRAERRQFHMTEKFFRRCIAIMQLDFVVTLKRNDVTAPIAC